MRELNISLPSKDSVNGQPNRNSSSWLRANFLKAFRRSSSKNRSSKLITNNNVNNGSASNGTLGYSEDDKHLGSSTIGPRGSLIMNQDQNNYPSHHHHDNHHTHQQSSCYSDEISSKRTSSGPSVASSLVSLPLSCSSVPPTPPLTPLPSYHSYQHQNQQQHQHQSQLQLQILENQQQQQNSTLATSHHIGSEDVIKELNRQLVEKDQLLQEVCMESINHLNTIESLKELVTQLRQEIDSLKNQNDQLNAKYSTNAMDKIKTGFNEYRSNQMQVNQLTNRNCA